MAIKLTIQSNLALQKNKLYEEDEEDLMNVSSLSEDHEDQTLLGLSNR